MNKIEARALLTQELGTYRGRTYHDLVKLVCTIATVEVRGPYGAEYQIEIEVMWDSPRERTDIRVMGTIDDGRLPGAILPLCESFILSPDGRFRE